MPRVLELEKMTVKQLLKERDATHETLANWLIAGDDDTPKFYLLCQRLKDLNERLRARGYRG
jgi:hypothetical protein